MMKKPVHPGAILREDVLAEFGLSVSDAAERLGISRGGHCTCMARHAVRVRPRRRAGRRHAQGPQAGAGRLIVRSGACCRPQEGARVSSRMGKLRPSKDSAGDVFCN